MDSQAVITALSFLNVITLAAGVVVYWRKGGNTAADQAIATYEAAVKAYEVRVTQLTQENQNLHKEISDIKQELGKIQGTLTEKNKKIEEMSAILANRNPAFDLLPEALKQSAELTQESKVYMKTSTETLNAILRAVTK